MTAPSVPVAGVMLAGGRASRMGGRDKAFATIGGEPIAERTIRLFQRLFPQVIVVTHHPERFAGLGVDLVQDRFAHCGPLGGIHAALLASRYPSIFAVGCDMPGLHAEPIQLLLARIGTADAIIPRWDGDIEPLHAVYAVRALPVIEAALQQSRQSIRDVLPELNVDYVPDAALRSVRGGPESLTNVNTPEELAAVGGQFGEYES